MEGRTLFRLPGTAAFFLVVLFLTSCATTTDDPTPAASQPTESSTQPIASATESSAPNETADGSASGECDPATSDYPEDGRSIRIIVPWGPGGNSDIGTRLVAAALERQLDASIVVENVPGASSQIGLTVLAEAEPDGYTLAHADAPSFFTTYLIPDRQAIYDRDDFAPVARYAGDAFVMAVSADSPFQTLQDVIDAAEAAPSTVKLGTNGQLSSAHTSAVKLATATGAEFALVHLDGSADQVTALLGNHIDVAIAGKVNWLPHLENETVRALAIMTEETNERLPDVPTLAEAGVEAYASTIHGIVAPAGTPEDVVCVLSAALEAAMDEGLREELAETGLDVNFMDSEAYAELLAAEEAEQVTLLQEIGVLE